MTILNTKCWKANALSKLYPKRPQTPNRVNGRDTNNQNFLFPSGTYKLSLAQPTKGSKNPSNNLTIKKISPIPKRDIPK
jgi:hypothetical protein